MSNFWFRIITAAGIGVVTIGAILAGQFTFSLLFSIIWIGALLEFIRLVKPSLTATIISFSVAVAFGSIIALGNSIPGLVVGLAAIGLLIINAILIFKKNDHFNDTLSVLTSVAYINVPLFLWFSLTSTPGTYEPVLAVGIILLIWAADSFAYLTGMSIGKNHIFKKISPKKTLEGYIGGIVFTMLAAWLFGHFFSMPYKTWLLIGLIISVGGPLGDLMESKIKRLYGVKDSANWLPGHGGMLDRFDAFFFAVPFVFLLLALNGDW